MERELHSRIWCLIKSLFGSGYARLGIHEIILKYFDIRLFIIAPFVIFFTLWLKIQIYYKSYIWIFISFAILLVTGFVFGINFPIDRDIIRNTYNEKFVEEYNYIDENLKLLYPKKDTNYVLTFQKRK
jgi:hypothetical protein